MNFPLQELFSGIILNQPEPNNKTAEILLTGDLCPIGKAKNIFQDSESIKNNIPGILQKTDLTISDLECPLTNNYNPIQKSGPHLVANPIFAKGIKESGIDVLTLANNHILDMGASGLFDTLSVCSEAGLKTVGAGKNLEEAAKPLFIKINEINIAILAFTEHEFSIASENSAGAAPLDITENYTQIKDAKTKSDFVLVILHGGNECYNLPSPRMVKTCNFFIDAGANAVICHHVHVAGGINIYKGAPIVYSTGNFLFDWPSKKDITWYTGYMVKLTVNPDKVLTLHLIPYYQFYESASIRLMNENEKKHFFEEIYDLSMTIQNNNKLKTEWEKYCNIRNADYINALFSANRLHSKILYKFLSLWEKAQNPERLNRVLNLFRCESHNEMMSTVLLNLLKKLDKR